jgi:hypothetical protein
MIELASQASSHGRILCRGASKSAKDWTESLDAWGFWGLRTIAAVFLTKLGDLGISQAGLLFDVEVGEHRVDGKSIGVVHGGGLRRERRGGRNEIWIRIEALAM